MNQKNTLFNLPPKRGYDAGIFWRRISLKYPSVVNLNGFLNSLEENTYLCETSKIIPVTKLDGLDIMKEFFVELDAIDDKVARLRSATIRDPSNWGENEQKSPLNNEYIWNALLNTPSIVNNFFDWAEEESEYTSFFPRKEISKKLSDGFYGRYYSETQTYLAGKEGNLYILSPELGYKDLGFLERWIIRSNQ
ncbi:MAG: hypothetical protein KAH20_13840 [Methylococcales bacterium]|nr:hypothetical protein [Methylococcales bacterium]